MAAHTGSFGELVEKTRKAREKFWNQYSKQVEEMIVQEFRIEKKEGYPWPAGGLKFICFTREKSVIMATDGLSDPPMPGEKWNGLEIYMESGEDIKGPVAASWIHRSLLYLALHAMKSGGQGSTDGPKGHLALREKLEKNGLMAVEMPDVGAGQPFLTEGKTTGVLLGLDGLYLPKSIPLPSGDARLITAKLLMGKEMRLVLSKGAPALEDIRKKFLEKKSFHISNLNRRSVV